MRAVLLCIGLLLSASANSAILTCFGRADKPYPDNCDWWVAQVNQDFHQMITTIPNVSGLLGSSVNINGTILTGDNLTGVVGGIMWTGILRVQFPEPASAALVQFVATPFANQVRWDYGGNLGSYIGGDDLTPKQVGFREDINDPNQTLIHPFSWFEIGDSQTVGRLQLWIYSPVPEPETWAALGIGFMVLLTKLGRRRYCSSSC